MVRSSFGLQEYKDLIFENADLSDEMRINLIDDVAARAVGGYDQSEIFEEIINIANRNPQFREKLSKIASTALSAGISHSRILTTIFKHQQTTIINDLIDNLSKTAALAKFYPDALKELFLEAARLNQDKILKRIYIETSRLFDKDLFVKSLEAAVESEAAESAKLLVFLLKDQEISVETRRKILKLAVKKNDLNLGSSTKFSGIIDDNFRKEIVRENLLNNYINLLYTNDDFKPQDVDIVVAYMAVDGDFFNKHCKMLQTSRSFKKSFEENASKYLSAAIKEKNPKMAEFFARINPSKFDSFLANSDDIILVCNSIKLFCSSKSTESENSLKRTLPFIFKKHKNNKNILFLLSEVLINEDRNPLDFTSSIADLSNETILQEIKMHSIEYANQTGKGELAKQIEEKIMPTPNPSQTKKFETISNSASQQSSVTTC